VSGPSLLTIELGTRCNNRCAFCPQHYLRVHPFQTRELTTREVSRRMVDAHRKGHDRVAFTGGEPTVRSDLPALIQTARDLGYAEIGITSNGRMLALPGAAEELLDAGLNRVSFSLHAADPALHDALSGVPGAHAQLLQGIRSLRECAARRGTELRLHSVSLLLPETLAGVEETIAMAAEMGADIHILQPFIASRPNLHVAQRYVLPPERLAAAVEQAAAVALRHRTRVKPYNIPYCLASNLEAVEVQAYRLATHKRHLDDSRDDRYYGQRQFFPIDRCPTCPTPCPGFRIEHYDRDRMVDEILEDAEDWRARELLVPALDLLPADALATLFRRLAEREREVVPLYGGYHWCPPEELAETTASAGIREAVHLLRTDWEDPKGLEPDPGNEEAIITLAGLLQEAGVRNRLFVSVLDLLDFSLPFDLLASRFTAIDLAIPRMWRGIGQNGAVAAHLETVADRVLACADNLARILPIRLVTFDSIRILGKELSLLQRAFASRIPPADLSNTLVRHRFTSPAYNFILWSNPLFL
jgi:MoaA/NifB/PqqE/SkfB family radical SAM enzyme